LDAVGIAALPEILVVAADSGQLAGNDRSALQESVEERGVAAVVMRIDGASVSSCRTITGDYDAS
jgi:hypothetical protein